MQRFDSVQGGQHGCRGDSKEEPAAVELQPAPQPMAVTTASEALSAPFFALAPESLCPRHRAMPVVFLASDEASFLTRMELPVDDGYLAV